MTNSLLIQQLLPQELWEKASKFNIQDDFLKQNSDLVILILQSRSLENDTDKESWFNLIPLMNEEQINKLRDILTREKNKIAEIEAKYENKKKEIEKKYRPVFNSVTYNSRMQDIRTNEAVSREQEMAEADSLLDNI